MSLRLSSRTLFGGIVTVGAIVAAGVPSHYEPADAKAANAVNPPAVRIDRIEPVTQYPGREVRLVGSGFTAGSVRSAMLFYHGTRAVLPSERTITPRLTSLSNTEIRFTLPIGLKPDEYGVALASGTLSNEVRLTVKPYRYRIELADLYCLNETRPSAGSDDMVTMGTVIADRHIVMKRTGELRINQGQTKEYSEVGTIASAIAVTDFLYLGVSLYENDGATVRATGFDLGVSPGLTLSYPDVVSAANRSLLATLARNGHSNRLRLTDATSLGFSDLLFAVGRLQADTEIAGRSRRLTLPVFRGGGGEYNVTIKITRLED